LTLNKQNKRAISLVEGDAVVVMWKAPEIHTEEDLQQVALVAASCALDLASTTMTLADKSSCKLHIGLSIGEVYLYYIGKFSYIFPVITKYFIGGVRDRWDWVIGGHPIGRAAQCERIAQGGELVISPDMWGMLRDFSPSGYQTKENNYRLISLAIMANKSPSPYLVNDQLSVEILPEMEQVMR
jgi:hypothetical protein